MKYLRKTVSLLLALSLVLGIGITPAGAAGTEPSAEKTTLSTEEPAEETVEATEETEETTAPTEETEPDKNSQSDSMCFESPAPAEEFQQVPLYLQTDYPKVPYSDGSLATSGCTMTCIAMVASWLRQEEILPDELARRFGDYDASNIQRMEAASIVLDLEFETVFHWWDVKEALKQGKVAIILLNAASDFCNTQHTVVATDITPDGKILVHDPYGPSYEKASLKEGFANGFSQETMTKGFDGAWIYEPYVPREPGENRYPDIRLTQEEKDLLAKIVWLESRGEPFAGQQAVAEVVLNRMASGKFSQTLTGTIMAEGQFRTAKFIEDAKPGELQYKAIEMAFSGHNVLPMDVYFFGRKAANARSWGQIGKHYFCYG